MADGGVNTEIRDRILGFVRDELLPPGTSVEPGDDLLSGGLLDSISVLRLATFVSEEFEFAIAPADFVVENFQSVDVLTDYVRRASSLGRDAT